MKKFIEKIDNFLDSKFNILIDILAIVAMSAIVIFLFYLYIQNVL